MPTPTPPPAQPQVQAPSTPNPPVPDSVIARQAALSSSHTNVKPAGTQNNVTPQTPLTPRFPGNNPNIPPAQGFEWRGSGPPSLGKGSWYNPKTGESFHPDLHHPPPIGPHWDYTPFRHGPEFRIMPDGRVIPKY